MEMGGELSGKALAWHSLTRPWLPFAAPQKEMKKQKNKTRFWNAASAPLSNVHSDNLWNHWISHALFCL
jgi:hypothetical protein